VVTQRHLRRLVSLQIRQIRGCRKKSGFSGS
jgi:hypothetical protein